MNAPFVSTSTAPSALQGVARLTHLGVIKVQGADAATFLQGQLTQDVLTMVPGESRLAAFCSAKGRMQASFEVLRCQGEAGLPAGPASFGDAEFLLVCSQDILGAVCKRLSMFVMRAKCRLTDASADWALYGLLGRATDLGAAYAYFARPEGPIDSRTLIKLPTAAGSSRVIGITAATTTVAGVDGVEAHAGVDAGAGADGDGDLIALKRWLWAEVQSGIGRITQATVEAFVPQMLNYESVGGVNFQKGCYPGQEVVARSQFRGTLKRRAYLVHGEVAMAAGDEVFSALDAEQACGTVVLAACVPADAGGGFEAIVSMQVAAAQAGGLKLAGAAGAAGAPLGLLDLPYALLEDV